MYVYISIEPRGNCRTCFARPFCPGEHFHFFSPFFSYVYFAVAQFNFASAHPAVSSRIPPKNRSCFSAADGNARIVSARIYLIYITSIALIIRREAITFA